MSTTTNPVSARPVPARLIPFGIMLHGPGGHMNAWKHPSNPSDASVNLGFYIDIARRAEANGIAFAFVADGLHITEKSIPHFLNRFEPLTILSALATTTSKIGLAGTLSTSYSDPFTVARQFASLDLISGGRAGWNVVTSPLEGSGRNYGRPHPDHALRYEIADEYLQVTQGLWDSWDDDAFVRDRDTGRYFSQGRFRPLAHKGRFFQVEGPLNIQRSAQGQPVLFQAGASDAGIDLAGKYADAIFTHSPSLEETRAFTQRVRQAAIGHQRSAVDVKVLPGISPIVGRDAEEAERKYEQIVALADIDDALAYLGRFFDHHDFGQYPLDEPFPELGELGSNSFRSTTDSIKQQAREHGSTLRQIALQSISPRSTFIGSAEAVAEEIIRWIQADACDGFILAFPVQAQGLDDFTQLVLPILQARGYHQSELPGQTLREHLGLPYKTSRHAEPAPIDLRNAS